jgi:hypothetical protein
MATSMTADPTMQERVFAYLTEPGTHPVVRRIDTHAASVFLEGDRAQKIKRAVHFPYLDYSTLAKRKAACDEEMKINRQFAPQIGTQEALMEKLLLVAALACQPGDRLIDLSGKLPRGLQFTDLVASVEPFYTRFYIYQLGFPQSRQQCCSNKPTKSNARSGGLN